MANVMSEQSHCLLKTFGVTDTPHFLLPVPPQQRHSWRGGTQKHTSSLPLPARSGLLGFSDGRKIVLKLQRCKFPTTTGRAEGRHLQAAHHPSSSDGQRKLGTKHFPLSPLQPGLPLHPSLIPAKSLVVCVSSHNLPN